MAPTIGKQWTSDRARAKTAGIDEVVSARAVVVGSGAAGLTAALDLSRRLGREPGVVLLTKSQLGQGGSSPLAQGGIAAAVGGDDSPERHAADTIAVGGGLSDPAVVRVLTARAPERIRFLLALGTKLDRADDDGLALTREAGHSRRRILHARDQTGAELVRALTSAVTEAPITVAQRTFAIDLVLESEQVTGVIARRADGRRVLYQSRAVVLATGGIGRLYARTTNPAEVTGDGLAIAARAGARLMDLEFVQFHPTALATGRDPMALLTEALRGEGAVLLDERGERFMLREHPDAELAPRDVVARAIWRVLERGGKAYLDARALHAHLATRFPNVVSLCARENIDPSRDLLPVAPAAHYHMGGIAVDARGRTSLSGLWAAGEDACTGAHGANRLASNSLLEAIVFASIVAEDVASRPRPALARVRHASSSPAACASSPAGADEQATIAELRDLMWRHVGLVREESGLRAALEQIEQLSLRHGDLEGETKNMLDVARLVTLAALNRRESRGAHYRSDYPQTTPGRPYRIALAGAPRALPQVRVA